MKCKLLWNTHTHNMFGGNKELNFINYCRNINQEIQDKKTTKHIQNQTKIRRETRNIYITSTKNTSTHNR